MSGRIPDEGRYSKISRRMWNDEKFRELSAAKPNAQTLFQRLLSGPELGCVPGLFPARLSGLAEALGWPLKATDKCWKEIAGKKMAEADWVAGLIWVPNSIFHNWPQSINAVLGWKIALKEMPECALKRKAIEALRVALSELGPQWVEAFSKASGVTSRRPSGIPSNKPSAKPSPKASGIPSDIQDTGSGSKIRILAADSPEDLSGSGRSEPPEAAAAEFGNRPEYQRKYELAARNSGEFALAGGVRWPEFVEVWRAWGKPFGITELPHVSQRIDRDISAVIEALASGRTVAELVEAGRLAETDDYIRGLSGGGPANFTAAVLRRLLARRKVDQPVARPADAPAVWRDPDADNRENWVPPPEDLAGAL